MNLSPSLFRRIPPSALTASVTKIPLLVFGFTIPVGWNWICSISIKLAPALNAIAYPSPFFWNVFDVTGYNWPAPPLANIVDFAWKYIKLESFKSNPHAPITCVPSHTSDVIITSSIHSISLLMISSLSAFNNSAPVLSPW